MKIFKILALASILILPASPSLAHWSLFGHHHSSGGAAAGPNDTDRASDYDRPIGSSDDPKLSTGWTSPHHGRNEQVHDYVRHERNGRTEHVHGYYRHSR